MSNKRAYIELEKRFLLLEKDYKFQKSINRNYETILSAIGMGMYIVNSDQIILWANEKIRDLFPGKEPIDQICYRFIESASETCKDCPVVRTFKNGKVNTLERYSTGRKRWLKIISQPIMDDQNKVPSALVSVTDITHQKNTLDELREREHRFLGLGRNLPGVTFQLSLSKKNNFRFDFISDRCIDLFGHKPDEILDDASIVFNRFPTDNVQAMAQALKASAKSLTPYTTEQPITAAKGIEKWLSITVTPRKISNASIVWDGIALDITDRKQYEKELVKTKMMLSNILESTGDGILVGHSDGTFSYANKKFSEIWKLSETVIQSKNRKKIHEEIISLITNPDQFFDDLEKLYFREDTSFDTIEFVDGRVIERFSAPLLNDNQLKGRVFSFRDVTDRKKTERALRETEEHLRSFLDSATNFVVYRLTINEQSPTGLRVVFVSPSVQNILGIPKPMEFETWFDLIHPDDAERIGMANQEAFKTQRFDEKFRMFNPERNEYRWIHSIATGGTIEGGWNNDVNGIMIDVTDMQKIKIRLENSLKALKDYAKKQRELNATLNVLLKKRDRDKLELEQNVIINLRELVFPYLEKMGRSHLNRHQEVLLNLAVSNLKEVTSKLTMKLSIPKLSLSPAEIKVANYVKQGKTSKEIASLLGLSQKTIRNQRIAIRNKIGLTGKKTNLRSYLLSLENGL